MVCPVEKEQDKKFTTTSDIPYDPENNIPRDPRTPCLGREHKRHRPKET
jgi:hypothetical protein